MGVPKFLNTIGQPTAGIGICDRCRRKFPLAGLTTEPETGLMVCPEDKDQPDPYLLPPRAVDQLTLPFYRPDTQLETPDEVDWSTVPGGHTTGV